MSYCKQCSGGLVQGGQGHFVPFGRGGSAPVVRRGPTCGAATLGAWAATEEIAMGRPPIIPPGYTPEEVEHFRIGYAHAKQVEGGSR
jgi:hypothetical protein